MSGFNKERWQTLEGVGAALEKTAQKYKEDADKNGTTDRSIIQALGIDLSDEIANALGEHFSEDEMLLVLYTLGYEILLKTGLVVEEAKKASEATL